MSVLARPVAVRRGLRVEYLGLAYNVIEAVVGVVAGALAGSVALIAFGLDAIVESASSTVIIWRFRVERSGSSTSEDAERKAVRLVAVAFYALAAYVAAHSTIELVRGTRPEESLVGIVLAVASLIVMPVLAWRKRLLAVELGSRSLMADSKQTSICTYLSLFLLVGLAANAWLGWWWADPVAGMAIAVVAAREGRELWTTEDLCC